ncbi:MAG: lipocalin family protein [Bacteroidetes bacterium]|nr:lipocalin family protein [Bacteroidota bacterium]
MKHLFAFLCLFLPACGGSYPPLKTVDAVDLDRYMGTWYEIMRLPNSFQKDCWNSTAEYSLRDDGKVRVVNRCRKDSVNGPENSATGKAWVVAGSNNSKLKVSFFWPFRGDYWIIELDENYQWVAVGAPSREYLWILAREPRWDVVPLEMLKERLAAKGFDVTQLIATNDYPLAILDAAPPQIEDVEEE